MNSLKYFIAVSIVLSFVFVSCNKTEYIDIPPQLQITIIDQDGRFVEDAEVKLYTSFDDWYNIAEPLFEAKSDSSGKCLFTNLQETYYYFDVLKGEDMQNSSEVSSIEYPLEKGVLNNVTVILYKNTKK